jgi:hypothetical protein
MQKWLKDGIIGLGAVAALAIIVSLSIDAPYEFIPTVQYGLFLGLIIGAPGGIIGGRNREGWAWPFAGGIIAGFLIGLLDLVFGIF